MSKLKKQIKKAFLKQEKKGNIIGKIYRAAVTKKRKNRHSKFAKLPIDENLFVFECFMGRQYSDSPKAIYEYLIKENKNPDAHYVWCFRDSAMSESDHVIDKEKTSIVRWGTKDYYKVYATAKYWFTNARIPAEIDRREGQIYTQCWHGTPLKKIGIDINSGLTESTETIRKVILQDAKRYSYMLSPSKYCSERFISAFGLKEIGKENIIIEEGYPRNDSIITKDEKDVQKIKEKLGIIGKKVILYAPTYREDQRVNQDYIQKAILDFDNLREKIGEEYIVLFRAHYYIANIFDFEKYQGFVMDVSKYPDINDLYVASDILITDYSSVFFDFAILKRPIIFYMHDLNYYKDELRGLYLPTEELPGPIVKTQDELIEKMKQIEIWSRSLDYKECMDSFNLKFAYKEDGESTARVVNKIVK